MAVTYFMAFTTRPRPKDAPGDDVEEEEDEEDSYDWFTLRQVHGSGASRAACFGDSTSQLLVSQVR